MILKKWVSRSGTKTHSFGVVTSRVGCRMIERVLVGVFHISGSIGDVTYTYNYSAGIKPQPSVLKCPASRRISGRSLSEGWCVQEINLPVWIS
jgi:hypothetical protein